MRMTTKVALTGALLATFALAGCTEEPDPTTVTVVTHDSFSIPDDVVASFEQESGLTVEFVAPGDSGSLVNELILTKDHPLGDVVYGIDNASASRAIDAELFLEYSSGVPAVADAGLYSIGDSTQLTAIDHSDVCINVDHRWFVDHDIPEPVTLDDLTSPTYQGLLSVSNPSTSATGLAFLLATVSAFGEGWPEYWTALRTNGVHVVATWSDAYYTDFSGPSSEGTYPLVLSYASSPPFEVGDDGVAPTGALLDTCFRYVEYAGVLTGTENPVGAGKVIDWMLSDEFQAALPDSMYVYPVSTRVEIPESWARFAPLSDHPWTLDPEVIANDREGLLREWEAIVLG